MNTYAYIDDSLDANLNPRILRAVLGMGASGMVLAGYWLQPLWIFTLAVVSVYLMVTAIIGEGLLDVLFRAASRETGTEPELDRNVLYGPGRAARGVTAGAALGSVISGLLLLDPGEIFALNVVGFYTGMTAIMAWDPVYGLFRSVFRSRGPAFIPVTAAANVRIGHVTETHPDTQRRAA